MTRRRFVVLRLVLEVDGSIEADEGRASAAPDDTKGLHRRTDGAGLPTMRVHVDLGVRHALLDVVDLRFDGRHVVLRAALQDELAPERGHARDADDVLPDVLRKDLREARE